MVRYDQSWNPSTIGVVTTPVPDVRLIEIVPDDGRAVHYAPGSHLNLRVPIGDRHETRSFSLVGDPQDDRYRIGVKRRDQSRGGSAYLWEVETGVRIDISRPNNLFELDFGSDEYRLIAAGIGITPIYGMALALVRRRANLHMTYIGKNRDSMLFLGELEKLLGDRLDVHCSDVVGRFDPEQYLLSVGGGAAVYLCGPIGLMDGFRRAWSRVGRDPSMLRYETFASSGTFEPEAFWVDVPSFGRRFTVGESESLLARLREEGIDVISDCERGECGTCQLDILDVHGEVDHRDVFLSDHEKIDGRTICVCVSRVAGGGVVLDPLYRPDAVVV